MYFALAVLPMIASCTSTDSQIGALESVVVEHKQQQDDFLAKQKAMVEEAQQKQLALIEANRAKLQNQSTLALATKPSNLANRKNTGSSAKPKVQKASVGGAGRASGNITLNAPWKCVPNKLKAVIREVSRRYGPVIVNSTHRSRGKNRRVGGARNSYHLRCQAIDFRVRGNGRNVQRFLRNHPHVGGLKRYRSGYFHIDTGPRRTWRG